MTKATDNYGRRVRVVAALGNRDYTPEGIRKRTPGVTGTIQGHSDSHGLCYKVVHDKGLSSSEFGYYDPDEFVFIDEELNETLTDLRNIRAKLWFLKTSNEQAVQDYLAQIVQDLNTP